MKPTANGSTSRHRYSGPALAILLVGCPVENPPALGTPHPCDGVWGAAPAAGRIHVDGSSGDGGDGTLAAPFQSLVDGIAAARTSGTRQVVVASGEYSGEHLLSQNFLEWQDSGLQIVGCGRDATRILGVVAEDEIGGGEVIERLQPVFDVTGDETANILIRDLAVVGGRRSIIVRGGAGATGPIVIQRVDVLDSVRLAVLVDGAMTLAQLLDVHVDGVEQDAGTLGWGIAIQTGMQVTSPFPGATVIEDVQVEGTQGLGILVDGGWVSVLDTAVTGVARVGDRLGRGLQLQNWTMGTVQGLVSSGNSDAAVFLESPGRNEEAVEILDSTLGPTQEAEIEDQPGEAAADGLAATQYWTQAPYGAETFHVIVDGVEFGGNSRAHVVAEASPLGVGTNNVFGKGTSFPLAAQSDAVVEGIGGGEPGQAPEVLEGENTLALDRQPVVLDNLSDD